MGNSHYEEWRKAAKAAADATHAEMTAKINAAKLDAIRKVIARFDWEFGDRQLALEEIERIAGDG